MVYFSANADPLPDSDTALLNFVFPAQVSQSEGHCPILKEKFELSEPASWQLLLNSGLPGEPTKHSGIKIPIIPGSYAEYGSTPFGGNASWLQRTGMDLG